MFETMLLKYQHRNVELFFCVLFRILISVRKDQKLKSILSQVKGYLQNYKRKNGHLIAYQGVLSL